MFFSLSTIPKHSNPTTLKGQPTFPPHSGQTEGKFSHHLPPEAELLFYFSVPTTFPSSPEVIIQLPSAPSPGEIKSTKGHHLEGGTTKKSRKNIVGLNLDSISTSSSPEKRKFRKNPGLK